MKKKILCLALSAAMLLSACGADANTPTVTTVGGNELDSTMGESSVESEVVTIADIKNKYGVLDEVSIKPFYNVEQDTSFTFHFNSLVEPNFAVTVHTDSKCESSSLVYQLNDAYLTDDGGLDVVVKPGSAVLKCDERADNVAENYNWGNAPIYYLCIRYDMDSKSPTPLVEPIVVPFTVKSNVSVPTVVAGIDTNGVFHIGWLPVEEAVSYNIYEAYRVRSESEASGMSRAEAGFVGDHLSKIATVDSSVTDFTDFSNDGKHNTREDSDGYIVSQNFYELGSYYVTAVDEDGNESFFSYPVSGYQYESQMPESFDEFTSFVKDEDYNISVLPSTVQVKFADGSYASMPINYTFVSETEYGSAIYEYNISGTLLSGDVEYKSPTGVYEKEIISTADVPTGIYEVQNEIRLVPTNDISTIIDESYKNVDWNIAGIAQGDESKKLVVDSNAVLARADIENARIVTDGVYTQDPFSYITTYISDERFSSSYVSSSEVVINESSESDDFTESEEVTVADEITSDNLVEEQIQSTEQQVEEANIQEVEIKGYPVFADSAEEEYLAQMMIAGSEVIDASGFPKLQDTQYLLDVLFKVIYQNPYIISPSRFGYLADEQAILVEYDLSKSEMESRQKEIKAEADLIAGKIFNAGMSDEEKCNAIWLYLEENTSYDNAALEAAQLTNFTDVPGFEDSFNAYGILVKKVGVCQSYAYAYRILADLADLDVMVLTGYLNKDLPHAWNAVNLGGSWYWLDVTNNENIVGFPYMLYQTSSDTAESADYVLDDTFALDKDLGAVIQSDNSKDYYYKNGLAASSDGEVASIIASQYPSDIMVAKLSYNADIYSDEFQMELVKALVAKGATEEDIMKVRFATYCGYFVMTKGE